MRKAPLIWLITVLFVSPIVLSSASRATPVDIDALTDAGLPGTGGSIAVMGCPAGGCPNGFASPFYSLHPGDIVNFGSVLLSPILTTFTVGGPSGGVFDLVLKPLLDVDFSSSNLITSILENGVSDVLVQCNVAAVGCSAAVAAAEADVITDVLSFTIPSGATGIQVAWTSPFVYVAPTPVPAALPMLAVGVLVLFGWWLLLGTRSLRLKDQGPLSQQY
jgi:hypothetical protein